MYGVKKDLITESEADSIATVRSVEFRVRGFKGNKVCCVKFQSQGVSELGLCFKLLEYMTEKTGGFLYDLTAALAARQAVLQL